jgi:hypothetical protein
MGRYELKLNSFDIAYFCCPLKYETYVKMGQCVFMQFEQARASQCSSKFLQWHNWLRHCTTNRKVAGSIPVGVTDNPFGRAMALGSTQPLTEMSTRNISCRVNAAGAWGWQPYHIHVPIVLKFGRLNLLEPSGPVQACNGTALQCHPALFVNKIQWWRGSHTRHT